jgi:tripartite-type tricarboxylate transporter receptor subunit TctC
LTSATLSVAEAQTDFPDRAVTFVVSTTAGSSVDITARLFSQSLAEKWKQPIVVENRGGANGQIAVTRVAQAPADGYTLLVTTGTTISTNPYLYPKGGTLALTGLAPVTKLVNLAFVISVRPQLKTKTFAELLTYIREHPDAVNFATSGVGGGPYLMAALLRHKTNLKFGIVPHRGGGDAVTTVLTGSADALIDTHMLTDPLAGNGDLVPVATTGSKRSMFAPNLPTVEELGIKGCEASGEIVVMAPKDTPPALLERLASEFRAVGQTPNVQKRLIDIKAEPVLNSPSEFMSEWIEERGIWESLIKATNLQAQ